MLTTNAGAQGHWSVARWDSAGLLPDPTSHPEPLVRVFVARTWGWKAAFAVHSWIVVKPAGARAYERWDVVGWGVDRGLPAVRRNIRPADGHWAGSPPEIVAALDGPLAEAAIPKLQAAIAGYPHGHEYRLWPGPNSNSFVAYLLRTVPELAAELPPTAIGKDYLVDADILARAPSGTGFQLSLLGVLGLTLALEEGLELNVLGLVFGVDPLDLAVKLPGIGRLGLR